MYSRIRHRRLPLHILRLLSVCAVAVTKKVACKFTEEDDLVWDYQPSTNNPKCNSINVSLLKVF